MYVIEANDVMASNSGGAVIRAEQILKQVSREPKSRRTSNCEYPLPISSLVVAVYYTVPNMDAVQQVYISVNHLLEKYLPVIQKVEVYVEVENFKHIYNLNV